MELLYKRLICLGVGIGSKCLTNTNNLNLHKKLFIYLKIKYFISSAEKIFSEPYPCQSRIFLCYPVAIFIAKC